MERMLDLSVRGTPGSPTLFYVTSICPQITITIALLIGLIVGKFLNCFAIGHELEGKVVGQVHKGIVMYDHLPSDCDAPPSSERSLQNEA